MRHLYSFSLILENRCTPRESLSTPRVSRSTPWSRPTATVLCPSSRRHHKPSWLPRTVDSPASSRTQFSAIRVLLRVSKVTESLRILLECRRFTEGPMFEWSSCLLFQSSSPRCRASWHHHNCSHWLFSISVFWLSLAKLSRLFPQHQLQFTLCNSRCNNYLWVTTLLTNK